MERRVSELVGVNPWAFGLVFNKLARGTFAHKVSNVMAHVGPMKASLKTMKGLSKTHMPTKWGGVELRDEGVTKGVLLVKAYPVLKIKESIVEPIVNM